jgi:hypothetical protein
MRQLYLPFLLTASLLAQGDLTWVAGLNLAMISFNDDNFAEEINLAPKLGGHLGTESLIGPLLLGVSFIQRGEQIMSERDEDRVEGYDIYNYLAVQGLYPFSILDQRTLAGLLVGQCVGGKAKVRGHDPEGLNSNALNLDYGVILGLEFSASKRVRIRTTYYLGLADVVKELPASLNFKHRGIGTTLIYRR